MRCDQTRGLTFAAMRFLAKYEARPDACPCCQHIPPSVLEECGNYDGMYDSEYKLYRHKLKDGRWADEFLQAQPWSSGPVAFLGLRVFEKDGQECANFLWPSEEIENA